MSLLHNNLSLIYFVMQYLRINFCILNGNAAYCPKFIELVNNVDKFHFQFIKNENIDLNINYI